MNSSIYPLRSFAQTYLFPTSSIETNGTIKNPINKASYTSQNCVWDTGATISCINQELAKRLSLISIGNCKIHTASGKTLLPRYFVDILLANNFQCLNVPVVGIKSTDEILIGMDLIKKGSMLITKNNNGNLVFEFAIPHIHKPQVYEKK